MKRVLFLLTPLLVLALAAGAYAQKSVGLDDNRKQTLDVDFSGEIDLNWAHQDDLLREVAFAATGGAWTAGGVASTQSAAFFWGRLTLNIQAHIADNVHGFIQLETDNIDQGSITPFGGTSGVTSFADMSGTPRVEQAYVRMAQVWHDRISLQLGLQDVNVAFRKPGRSGAYYADLTEAESAWHGVNLASPVTFYDTMAPVGGRFQFEDIHENHVDFNLWLLPSVSQSQIAPLALDSTEELYMTTVDWYPTGLSEPEGEAKIQLLLAYMIGGATGTEVNGLVAGGHDMQVWTLGLGFDLVGIGDPGLELWANVYWQGGSAGRTAAAGGTDLDQGAWALDVGFRYDAVQTQGQPWFELNYTTRSGDDSTTDGDHEGFISYENVDDLAIVEGNELGLDIDTNYSAFKIKGGIKFSSAHGSDNIALNMIIGLCSFNEDQPLGAAAQDEDMGWEVDAKLTYWYNDQLSFSLLVAFLTGADALDNYTVDSDSSTWLMNIGMNFKF